MKNKIVHARLFEKKSNLKFMQTTGVWFMIYLSSFKLSDHQVKNPNIYPYNVYAGKDIEPFVFAPITIFYGNNGSGKSTLLNIIANSLELKGKEYATSNSYGIVDYCGTFSSECSYSLGEDEFGRAGGVAFSSESGGLSRRN